MEEAPGWERHWSDEHQCAFFFNPSWPAAGPVWSTGFGASRDVGPHARMQRAFERWEAQRPDAMRLEEGLREEAWLRDQEEQLDREARRAEEEWLRQEWVDPRWVERERVLREAKMRARREERERVRGSAADAVGALAFGSPWDEVLLRRDGDSIGTI